MRLSFRKLSECKTAHLRRLAKFLRVRRWSRLKRSDLIEEVAWKLDPFQFDQGMY